MGNHFGQHAVVIGGSMAGLMTARVLADYFASVTVLERDHIEEQPALHKSIPQGNHLHGVLMGGLQVMASLYPGFREKLATLGSVRCRMGKELVFYLPNGKAYSVTGTVREPRDFGIDFYCQSRGLLEYCVRQCTLESANVTVKRDSTVQGLVYEGGRVCGVRYTQAGDTQTVAADFVIDAGGRGSHAPRWLTELGFTAPAETTIGVDIAYASTKFRVPEDYDRREVLLGFVGPPPEFPNGGLMEIIEGNTWHVTLMGRFGDYPPHDEEGFLGFAKSLHTPKLYDLIKDAERVADITFYRYPTSIQRHYERLPAFPDGFLVLGDAICSFNPFYGQGMSSAALQVQGLQHLLTECAAQAQGLKGLAQSFFPKAAEIIFTPWTFAALQDFPYPQTQGERPAYLEEEGQYFAAVDALTADDIEVHRLMVEVFNLMKPLSALREEPLRSRVLEQQRQQASA
jgi:2-polyprenyl-6-methoxyphenol hydroxylase-like FAD-dependent oxidoreductase